MPVFALIEQMQAFRTHRRETNLLDESYIYKSKEEQYDALNELRKQDNELMINTICGLAKLNGYEVEVRWWENGAERSSFSDLFSDMRECMVFKQNGERVLVLSLEKVIALWNNLNDSFSNTLDLMITVSK